LDALTEVQRDAITVVVFLVTFFVALGIGRFLKRRAGVQLGLVFRLFCLIIAFYAAIAVYGVHAPWRYHVGAAAILLSTALVVALVNRYVWDLYFEKRRRTTIPHFLREIVGGIIFLIVLLLVLSYGYHAEAQLKGLLAGSGVVAIIVGFAGQNLFAGIIGGISIHERRHLSRYPKQRDGESSDRQSQLPEPNAFHAPADERRVWRAAQPRKRCAHARHYSGARRRKRSTAPSLCE
jgi:hypothetical protein